MSSQKDCQKIEAEYQLLPTSHSDYDWIVSGKNKKPKKKKAKTSAGNHNESHSQEGREELNCLHKWYLLLESSIFLKVKFQITLILMMVQEKVEAPLAIPAPSQKKNVMMMETLMELMMIRPVWLP
jgi:hypothetical protein